MHSLNCIRYNLLLIIKKYSINILFFRTKSNVDIYPKLVNYNFFQSIIIIGILNNIKESFLGIFEIYC